MKQIIANLSWKNWNKKPGNLLTTIFGVFSVLLSVKDEFLSLLHEMPIPINPVVDLWIQWLFKAGVWVTSVLMVLSRKRDIDVNITQSPIDEPERS